MTLYSCFSTKWPITRAEEARSHMRHTLDTGNGLDVSDYGTRAETVRLRRESGDEGHGETWAVAGRQGGF